MKGEDQWAALDLADLVTEWQTWNARVRQQFIASLQRVSLENPDLADMVRFVLREGRLTEWDEVAFQVVRCLPPDEAFQELTRRMAALNPADTPNLAQALAGLEHPGVVGFLSDRLNALLASETFFAVGPSPNRAAAAAVWAIWDLLKLGVGRPELGQILTELRIHHDEYVRMVADWVATHVPEVG